jgi:hypothetical protein
MNEKIRQLMLQVGFAGYGEESGFYNIPVPAFDSRMERFAELIVRECANHCDLLLDHKISSEWSRGTHDCSRAIKKHFGVE